MPQEEQQLRLEVVLDDQATAQIARLRGEMQKLTGGETQGGIDKLQKQAESLQKKLIPLYDSFSRVVEGTRALTSGLTPMALGITAIGAAATVAAAGLVSFMGKMTEILQLRRLTGLPEGFIKNLLDVQKIAGIADDNARQNIDAFAKFFDGIMRDSSEITKTLRQHFLQAGPEGFKAGEEFIARMREYVREGKVGAATEELIRALQHIRTYIPEGSSPQKQANLARAMLAAIGLSDDIITKTLPKILEPTEEQNRELKALGEEAEKFHMAIAAASKELTEFFNELARLTLELVPLVDIAKTVADIIEGAVRLLKEFDKPTPEAKEPVGELATPPPEMEFVPGYGYQPRVQKQSFIGSEEGFRSLVMKASFEENTDRLEDDTRARHELLNELIILNDFFRGRFGGGGGGPGSTTITTPDGSQIVTSPNDQIRVADALIQTPDATLIASQPQSLMRAPQAMGTGRGVLGHQYPTAAERAVDRMISMIGMHEQKDREALTKYLNSPNQQMSGFSPDKYAWCATAVNATLAKENITPTGSPAAASYTSWGGGSNLSPEEARKGQMFVVRGLSPRTKQEGKHVGFITGPMTPEGKIPTVSANIPDPSAPIKGEDPTEGRIIGRQDYDPSEIHIRPIPQAALPPEKIPSWVMRPSDVMTAQRPSMASTNLAGLDRAMGNEMSHKVEGTGKISVDVAAPKKTSGGNGADLFKPTQIERQTQMEPAGPMRMSMVP